MTIQQALRKARKLWGKNACVECDPKGAFITQEGTWRETMALVCEHGKHNDHKLADNPPGSVKAARYCPREFYIIAREPELKLGRPKYRVAKYQVGKIMMGMFFEVRGSAESFERAFEIALQPGHLWT